MCPDETNNRTLTVAANTADTIEYTVQQSIHDKYTTISFCLPVTFSALATVNDRSPKISFKALLQHDLQYAINVRVKVLTERN